MLSDATIWIGKTSALPDVPPAITFDLIDDPTISKPPPLDPETLQPISGFTCFIDYEGAIRRIVCRRYDLIGDRGYVGAICLSANGYRQFRTDRIDTVSDVLTGETIGDGSFFSHFAVDSRTDKAPTWGLSSSQKATLVAGLNVLAFMARCDGEWHYLETEPIEHFICSMWLRKEWPGEPPLHDIVEHAQRLSPDSETFFRGLSHYARSSTSTKILKRAVTDVINADGVIAEAEFSWAMEIDSFFRNANFEAFQRMAAMAHDAYASEFAVTLQSGRL